MASAKFPTFPSIDFSKLDLGKLDFSKLDMGKIDLPKVDAEAVTNAAKDVVYIGIGVAVLAFQKAQVLSRDVTKSLTEQFDGNKVQFGDFFGDVEGRLAGLEEKWDTALEDFEKRLPEPVSTLLGQAHGAAKSARKQVREKLVPAAA